jgi:flagellar motor switch protein FliG
VMSVEIAQLQSAKMSKMQKLAALLVMLGPESATQVLKHMEPHELEAVSMEMSKLTLISQELQAEILQEFTEVAVQAGTSVAGGVNFTKNVLEKSVGLFRSSDILSRIAPSAAPMPSMQQFIEMDTGQLCNMLKQEQPQTIALVASYLPSDKISSLLMLLRPDMRDHVVERLALLGPTPVEVVERIVNLLSQKSGVKTNRLVSQTGGVKTAAEVLNSLEKNLSNTVLSELEKRNPELGLAIRQKMFTFEDLASLDAMSLQKVLREVDLRDLALAFKNASGKVKAKLLACISKRAAETVNEESSFLGPVKKKDVEAAQQRIIESVRKLEGEGELDLGNINSRSADEVLV